MTIAMYFTVFPIFALQPVLTVLCNVVCVCVCYTLKLLLIQLEQHMGTKMILCPMALALVFFALLTYEAAHFDCSGLLGEN